MESKFKSFLESIDRTNEKQLLFILLGIWAIIELLIFCVFGIRKGYDSVVYEIYASEILSGKLPEVHHRLYITYIGFMAAIFSIGGAIKAVIFAQVVLSGIATVCFFKLGNKISGSKTVAVLSTLLLISWVEIHGWDMYIYTESLFTGLLIISIWALVNRSYGIATLLVIAASLVRPNGILLIFSVFIYVLYHYKKHVERSLFITAILILLSIGLIALNEVLVNFTLIESYVKGEVVFPDINYWVQVPDCLYIPENKSSLVNLVLFIFHNPVYFSKLAGTKLVFYLGHIKPYYSAFHNLIIALILWPLYGFCIFGLASKNINKGIRILLGGFILFNCITAMLTSESWDGRFLIPVLPFVFLLAAVGINSKLSQSISNPKN
jgi:hypothetical protein